MQESDPAPQDHDAKPLPTNIICHDCMAENDPFDHLCRKCGTPLTAHAEMDFMLSIRARGNTYYKATHRPQRGIVVVGMWLIFGFPMLTVLFAMIMVLTGQGVAYRGGRDVLAAIIASVVLGAMLYVFAMIPLKTTRAYYRARRGEDYPSDEDDGVPVADDEADGEEESFGDGDDSPGSGGGLGVMLVIAMWLAAAPLHLILSGILQSVRNEESRLYLHGAFFALKIAYVIITACVTLRYLRSPGGEDADDGDDA